LPAPSYDQLSERRFEFIPLWGFLVFVLYTLRRVDCRRRDDVAVEEVPWGEGKRTLIRAYMLFLARRRQTVMAREQGRFAQSKRYAGREDWAHSRAKYRQQAS
jgi:hypothetical protein